MSLYVFYIYNINHMSRKAPLFPKYQREYKCDVDFMQRSF